MTALNFDPYAALAEIENGKGLRANRASRANPAPTLAQLAPLALSPAQISKCDAGDIAVAALAEWSDALAALDVSVPPICIAPDRWRVLLIDARWLCQYHGRAAAALGWSASDLFGIDPLPGWGGLADRLEGTRNLVLTDRIAHWSRTDLEGWLWRRTLTAKPVMWEVMN